MAIKPGTYNFTLQRRSDHSIPLLFKDSNNAAINLTGYTVQAQVWDRDRNIKYADFAVTYTDRAAGSVAISLTDVQTETFITDKLYYDVLLTNPAGLKEYYLEGIISITEGYTA
tara:strand:- start:1755 stop:2096 length:342 start_codon:yes stop_codon:yes gene_type:complete